MVNSRRSITVQERKALRHHARTNPRLRQKQLSEWFHAKFGHRPSQGTISESLSSRFAILEAESDLDLNRLRRLKAAKYPELEAALFEWYSVIRYDVRITDDAIKKKAEILWRTLPVYEGQDVPQFSNGWLQGFKKRYAVSLRERSGGAGTASFDDVPADPPDDSITEQLRAIQAIIQNRQTSPRPSRDPIVSLPNAESDASRHGAILPVQSETTTQGARLGPSDTPSQQGRPGQIGRLVQSTLAAQNTRPSQTSFARHPSPEQEALNAMSLSDLTNQIITNTQALFPGYHNEKVITSQTASGSIYHCTVVAHAIEAETSSSTSYDYPDYANTPAPYAPTNATRSKAPSRPQVVLRGPGAADRRAAVMALLDETERKISREILGL